ncbi:MAG: shikimate dehydrogenase [Candidatus Omnitrophota bacterium]
MEACKSTYGIIGYPLQQTLSPVMHNTAFQALKVDAEYKVFPLKEEELKGFFAGLHEKTSPIFGLNVTVPYKEKVIPLLDSLSPYANKILAVNTVVISPQRQLIGQNTDGPGFLMHLTELGIHPEGKRISILGAGGAARAIISVLCLIPERPQSIRIYDVEKYKVEQLISDFRDRFDVSILESVKSLDDLNIEIADLLINTTPIGMKKEDPCLIDENILHPNMFVYDVIYTPQETKLLKLAKAKGAQVSNGLGMLFYQGVLAFQHWAQIELDDRIKKKMRMSLMGALKK